MAEQRPDRSRAADALMIMTPERLCHHIINRGVKVQVLARRASGRRHGNEAGSLQSPRGSSGNVALLT